MNRRSIGIIGYTGRLGSLIFQNLDAISHLCSSGLHFNKASNHPLEQVFTKNDIVIVASSPSFISKIFKTAAVGRTPLIIATTGWSQDDYAEQLDVLSKLIPIIIIPNGSFVSLLQERCVEILSKFLDENFDVDIIERHHKNKTEKLSGTAENLAFTVQKKRSEILGKKYKIREVTEEGARPQNVIDIRSLRTGNIFGEQEISFTSENEMIMIKHVVFDRRVFAQGIIKILVSLIKKPKCPGIYFLTDFFE